MTFVQWPCPAECSARPTARQKPKITARLSVRSHDMPPRNGNLRTKDGWPKSLDLKGRDWAVQKYRGEIAANCGPFSTVSKKSSERPDWVVETRWIETGCPLISTAPVDNLDRIT